MSDLNKLFSKKYGELYFGDAPPNLKRISTGYVGLDIMLGGGIPLGRIIQIAAKPSNGKSTTCLCIARELIRQGYTVAYIDLEKTLDKDRLDSVVGVDLPENSFHYLRPADGETALSMAMDAAEVGLTFVVIDSVPNLLPKTVMESDVSKQSYSPVAKLLSNNYSKLATCYELAQSSLVLINQVRDNVGSMFGGTTTPGGYAIKHAMSVMIELYRSNEAKDGSSYTINYKTTKNKTYIEKLTTEILYFKSNGRYLCPYSSMVSEGVNAGVLRQAGSYYKIAPDYIERFGELLEGSETIGQGKERVIEFLLANKEIYDYMYSLILETHGLHQSCNGIN